MCSDQGDPFAMNNPENTERYWGKIVRASIENQGGYKSYYEKLAANTAADNAAHTNPGWKQKSGSTSGERYG